MKKNVLLLMCFVALFSCAKTNEQVEAPENAILNNQTIDNNNSLTGDCSLGHCTGDVTLAIYGCYEDGSLCPAPSTPYIESDGAVVNITETARIIRKPTRPVGDETLTASLSNLNVSLIYGSVNSLIFNVRLIGKPEILFQKTFSRINVNTFKKAGDTKLAVTNLALDNYKKYPTIANRKIILQQVFNQLTTTYRLN